MYVRFLAPDIATMHSRFHIHGDIDEPVRVGIGTRVVHKMMGGGALSQSRTRMYALADATDDRRTNVRYWHLPDMRLRCTCPLSGVKQTCHFALQMSAYDPKRTSGLIKSVDCCVPFLTPPVASARGLAVVQTALRGRMKGASSSPSAASWRR